jgi:hypothetical protein
MSDVEGTPALERAYREALADLAPLNGIGRDEGVFRTGFLAGWDAHTANTDAVLITREELARLQRKAGEGPMVFP